MSNYIKGTNFAGKDALETGNPAKIVKGTEIDDEFNSIVVAVNSKANTNSPALTGVPTSTTAVAATSNAQIATTAFVQAAIVASTPAAFTLTAGDAIAVSGSTVSHADTSSQNSVNNSGNTFIQGITLDTFGHITEIVSGTVTDYTAPDPTTAQVLTATAEATAGSVGTYGYFLNDTKTTSTVVGGTIAGSDLTNEGINITPAGTWRAMNYIDAADPLNGIVGRGLFLRIS